MIVKFIIAVSYSLGLSNFGILVSYCHLVLYLGLWQLQIRVNKDFVSENFEITI